ncbi:MAG: adenosylcobinamide amidohydrolase, partial [Methanocorpusculum sp.]|nr:adenosylcobinamide amidohydrolase [Methanocorpusculum sp.]
MTPRAEKCRIRPSGFFTAPHSLSIRNAHLTSASMRYYLRKNTLIVRGKFRAASNGAAGGLRDTETLLNISIPPGFSENAAEYIDRRSSELGFLQPQFGLLTAVPIHNLCIAQYDEITVFATAAVSDRNRTINLIVTCAKPLTDAALLGALMTV